MADPDMTLMLEHLKALRTELASVKDDTRHLRREMGVLRQHVAALVTGQLGHAEDIASLTARVERIERRLDLVEET